MLVLSRKVGEKIIVNGNIEIVVTMLDRNKCRIGVIAPKEYKIIRQELIGTSEGDHHAEAARPE